MVSVGLANGVVDDTVSDHAAINKEVVDICLRSMAFSSSYPAVEFDIVIGLFNIETMT